MKMSMKNRTVVLSELELSHLLAQAKEAHTRLEKDLPEHAWQDWYAVYIMDILEKEGHDV